MFKTYNTIDSLAFFESESRIKTHSDLDRPTDDTIDEVLTGFTLDFGFDCAVCFSSDT